MDTQKNKISSLNAPALILCAIIIAVAAVSYLRSNQEKVFPQQVMGPQKTDFIQWIEAVKAGEEGKAIPYAARICGGCDLKKIPDPDYLKLAEGMKCSTMVFDAPFGKNDFLGWKDAFAVRKFISDSNIRSGADEIEKIAQAVIGKLECRPTAEGKLQARSVAEILERGYGNTHEITRVLCDAVYQSGYDVMTVSIFDETRNVIHLLCEIRGKNQAYVADVRFKRTWKDMTFEKLMQDASLTAGVWTDNIAKSAKNHVYGLPAEVQDYKVYNQDLGKALSSSEFSGSVRLGEDPRGRIEKYLSNFESPEKVQITYWRYPFIVLMSQPDFPAGWKLNIEKAMEQQ